jgi:GAF domain-containing protein/signal transduction histidine kinase
VNNASRSNLRPFWPLLNELVPLPRLKRMIENLARLTGQHVGLFNARGDWLVPIPSSRLRDACHACQQFYTNPVRDRPSEMKHVCGDCSSQRFGVPVLVRQHLFGILVTEPTKIDHQSLRSVDVSLSHPELAATREDLSREVTSELTRLHAERISGLLLGNASTAQVAEFCDLLVTTVREIIGCDYVAMFIRNEHAADGLPKLAATCGAESESLAVWRDLQRLAVKCLEHGEPIDVKNALDEPNEPRQQALAFALPFSPLEAHSIAALPVAHSSSAAPIAVIMAAAKHSHTFDEQDWRVLREIVRLTALNAPTTEHIPSRLHRNESLKLLTSFTDKVSQLHSSDDILDALLGAVVEATESQVGEIVVTQPDNPVFVKIRATYGSLHSSTGRLFSANLGMHGQVIRTGLRIGSIDLQKEPSFQSLLYGLSKDADRDYQSELARLHSGICLPIRTSDGVSGVLCLARFKTRQFGKEKIEVAELIADRIGRVLEGEKKYNLDAAKAAAEHDLLELTRQKIEKVEDCSKTLKSLYERLVTAAMTFKGVKYASVREYSPTTDHIRYLHINDSEIWPKDMPSEDWRRDTSGGRHAARTGEIHRFGSKESAKQAIADSRYVVAFPDVESHISIPLKVAGFATLIWTLESPRQNLFDGQTLASLVEVARDAETVLNWLGKTRELLSIIRLGQDCASSMNISELVESAAELFQDAFDAKTCAIYLLDPSRNGIECVGVSKLGLHADPSGEHANWYSFGDDASERGLTSHVARRGQSLRIDDLTRKDLFSDELWELHQHAVAQSSSLAELPIRIPLLIVPLKGRTGTLGVIRLAGRDQSGQPFSVDEQNQAERFAKRLSLAIEQLFFQEKTRIADRFVKLPVHTDPNLTARDVAATVCAIMGCPSVEVRLKSGKYLRLAATYGDPLEIQPDLISEGSGLCGSSIQPEPHVIFVRDTHRDHRWESIRHEKNDSWSTSVRSVIVVPLQLNATSEPLGTLSIYSNKAVRFGPADLPIIDEIVHQASLLITDARQHERRFRLLEAIRIASVQAVDEQNSTSMAASAADIAEAFSHLIPEACITVWLLNDSKTHLVCREVCNKLSTKGIRGYLARLRDNFIRVLLDENQPPRWISALNEVTGLMETISSSNSTMERRWIRSIKTAGIAPISLAGGLTGAIFCYITDDRIDLLTEERTSEIREDFVQLASHVKLVFGTIQLLEQMRKELELTAPLAMIGALLDSILHHLVQPLQNMRVTMPNARRLAEGHAPLCGKLESLRQEIERMDRNIIDLKSIVTGRNVRTTQRFDVASTVRKISERACQEWPRLEVVSDIPEEAVQLAGIEPVLEAGVRMVVQNAAESMHTSSSANSNRRLTLALQRADGNIIVTITDTGSGMSEAVLRASQQPGFTTKAKGSGMGLAVAHAACNWHGGHLQITSEVDRGTTVKFHIPEGMEDS